MTALAVVQCHDLPENASPENVYHLLPKDPDERFYWERVDRAIGWITKEEQTMLRNLTIGVAGCGGMGGTIAERFIRAGIGEVRIADCEVFDASNINRQFAAGRYTIGKSKAFETTKLLRQISDDTTLVVYPQGITEATADDFAAGCDLICDEIEFWAVSARLILHRSAQKFRVPVFCSPTVGTGTRLFVFTPEGMDRGETMENLLGFTFEEAKDLQKKIQTRIATKDEVQRVMRNVLNGLIPELPEYSLEPDTYSTVKEVERRLYEEGRASILPTNPALASGFITDHVLFYHFEKHSGVKRHVGDYPPIPGYRTLEALEAPAVPRKPWW